MSLLDDLEIDFDFEAPKITDDMEIELSEDDHYVIDAPKPVKPAGAFSLRDYQEASVQSIQHALERDRSTILVLATGCGKTVVFSQVTLEEVKNRSGKVLIIAHTEELLDQAADKLEKTTGLRSSREKADQHASVFDEVVVASVQTIGRKSRLQKWDPNQFTMIIIDEAHRSLAKLYMNVIDHFTGAKVLGVTATADRGDQKSLGRVYNSVAFEYGILEACRDGYLVPPYAKTIPLKIDLSGLMTGRGDLNTLEVANRVEPFLVEIAKILCNMQKEDPRCTMIFLPSIDTAEMMADAIRMEGHTADFVAGDRERCPDRKARLTKFENGETEFMCNAMLLTEGYDNPLVSRIVPLRPTKIRSLYCQIVGRGTRILPGVIDGLNGPEDKEARIEAIKNSAKPNLEIVDFLWITERLDLIKPAHLVSGNPEVVKKVIENSNNEEVTDLIEAEQEAERDLIESLRREAEKYRNKKGKTFDPLKKAYALNDEDLASYKPKTQWEAQRPTQDQCQVLVKHGLDPERVRYRGLASLWIKKIITREKLGLCSLKQMSFLERMGVKDASNYSKEDAGKAMSKKFAGFKKKGRK